MIKNFFSYKSEEKYTNVDEEDDDIKKANNLSSNTIKIDQKLIIPNLKEYTVKSGDSLWKISNKYNTTVNKIKNINNLSSDKLSVGQKLLIP